MRMASRVGLWIFHVCSVVFAGSIATMNGFQELENSLPLPPIREIECYLGGTILDCSRKRKPSGPLSGDVAQEPTSA